jgi:branched-chain amino acid aminotransferase
MIAISAYQILPEGPRPLPTQAQTADEWTRQVPQGFYTTFRTLAGGTKVLGLKAHLARLYGPAKLQDIRPVVKESELRNALSSLVAQNAPAESRVRLILSATDSPGAVFALIEPFQPPADSVYRKGVNVVTMPLERVTPRLKSTEFIDRSQPARQLVHGDTYEVLLVRSGRILEGMTSNFFYIRDGMVGTARQDILLGITRKTVLRVVRGSGFGIVYRPLKQEQVTALSEAFITSSSRGIVPVVRIDEGLVGEGVPGEITKQLMMAYKEYVLKVAEKI